MASVLPGVGLRAAHIEEVLVHRPDIAGLEVHPENYMTEPAARHRSNVSANTTRYRSTQSVPRSDPQDRLTDATSGV